MGIVRDKDFEVRRVFLPSEAEEIYRLQADADVFQRHYPRHREWLRMAVGEIAAGKRFAFGVYKSIFRDGSPALILAGSVILKSETYSDVMQLKNLYVAPALRRQGYGRALIEAAVDLCLTRGANALETEVPVAEAGTVTFLGELGFLFTAHLPSPYRQNETIYRMHKVLPPAYIGDPLDLYEVAQWVFRVRYGFVLVPSNRPLLEFRKLAPPWTPLLGTAVVRDDADNIPVQQTLEHLTNTTVPLLALVTRQITSEDRVTCAAHRILCLDRGDLDRLLEGAWAFERPPFEREDIGGIIAPLRSKYLQEIRRTAAAERTYYKAAPIGRFVRTGNTIFFYVEQGDENVDAGIHAVATVRNCVAGSPDDVWLATTDAGPMFPTRTEYTSWAVDTAEVVAITFENVTATAPIRIDQIQRLLRPRQLRSDRLGKQYLSARNVEQLLALADPPRSPRVRETAESPPKRFL